MDDAYRIGRIFGITIRVQRSLPLMLGALLFFSLFGGPESVAATLALLAVLFPVLIFHELGHGLVARSFGVHVHDITLTPLGGMARMSEVPESGRIEALIAFAGPAANFLTAGLVQPLALGTSGALGAILGQFVLLSVLLGAFNLVPAFPSDGGRILRALLSLKLDWLRATELAVRVGRWTILALVIASFFFGILMVFLMLIIAGYLLFSGQKELLTVRLKHTGSPFAGANIFEAMQRAAAGAAGPMGTPPPRDVPNDGRAEASPRSGDARRPEQQDASQGKGFSEDDIEALENFHGRLQQFRTEEP